MQPNSSGQEDLLLGFLAGNLSQEAFLQLLHQLKEEQLFIDALGEEHATNKEHTTDFFSDPPINTHSWQYLIHRVLRGDWTVDQAWVEYTQWAASNGVPEKIWNNITLQLEGKEKSSPATGVLVSSANTVSPTAVAQEKKSEATGKVSQLHRGRRIWLRAAAAVLLIGLAASIFVIRKNKMGQEELWTETYSRLNSVQPASNKAQLITENGAVELGEQLPSGTLSEGVSGSGAVSVRWEQNGVLSYQESEKNKGSLGKDGFNASLREVWHELRVPKGGVYQIMLSDGTRVWMNNDSKLRYPLVFSGKRREVELSGEAYFDVAHRSNHPFIVKAGGEEIKVLGTRFNVKSFKKEQVSVVLEQGKIVVAEQTLEPGQKAWWMEKGLTGSDRSNIQVEPANLGKELAWREGVFRFDGTPLGEIMEELSRWYNLPVQLEEGLYNRAFAGEISREESLGTVLKVLSSAGVQYRMEGDTLKIKKDGAAQNESASRK